jgi:hypothetical protein
MNNAKNIVEILPGCLEIYGTLYFIQLCAISNISFTLILCSKHGQTAARGPHAAHQRFFAALAAKSNDVS